MARVINPQVGHTYFDQSGRSVRFVANIDNGDGPQFLVNLEYEYENADGANFYFGDKIILVDQIFDDAPVEVYHPEIVRLREQIRVTQAEFDALYISTCATKAEQARLSDMMARNEQLSTLERLMNGEITHFMIRSEYNGPKIEAAADFLKRNNYPALVLKWDGRRKQFKSGGNVIPCLSYIEALALVHKELSDYFGSTNAVTNLGNSSNQNWFDAAKRFDWEPPAAVTDALAAQIKGKAQSEIDRLENEILICKQKLATLDRLCAAKE